MSSFEVGLNLFWATAGDDSGHGHTDSACYGIEAESHLEAVVLATQNAIADGPDGMRIAHARPYVVQDPA